MINYFSSKERAEALVQELSSVPCTSSSPQQPRFLVVGGDVGNEPDLQHMVDETIRVMGRLDYVFSNGGWTEMLGFKSLDDNLDETVWDKCFDYNVKSHLRLMKIARPHLERTEGAFVTTASTAGVTASGSSLAYSVSKAGQIHLVKGLAKLCGPKIRVNSISPGLIMTDWGQRFDEDFKTNYKNRTLLKKIAEVEVCFSSFFFFLYMVLTRVSLGRCGPSAGAGHKPLHHRAKCGHRCRRYIFRMM